MVILATMLYISRMRRTAWAFVVFMCGLESANLTHILQSHDDVIKWKHFPRYWPFVRGIHRSPVNSPHKGQWRGALMFSLICVWINGWENNREADDLRRYRTHYDVIVMLLHWQWDDNFAAVQVKQPWRIPVKTHDNLLWMTIEPQQVR